MGLDTKTYWLTDRQSQYNFDFDFDNHPVFQYETLKVSEKQTILT
jgi:hypothetical protein